MPYGESDTRSILGQELRNEAKAERIADDLRELVENLEGLPSGVAPDTLRNGRAGMLLPYECRVLNALATSVLGADLRSALARHAARRFMAGEVAYRLGQGGVDGRQIGHANLVWGAIHARTLHFGKLVERVTYAQLQGGVSDGDDGHFLAPLGLSSGTIKAALDALERVGLIGRWAYKIRHADALALTPLPPLWTFCAIVEGAWKAAEGLRLTAAIGDAFARLAALSDLFQPPATGHARALMPHDPEEAVKLVASLARQGGSF